MKKIVLLVLAFAIALAAPITINAQSSSYPTVALNISSSGAACGRVTPTTKCFLPVLVNGETTTLYFDFEGNYGTGWVQVEGSDEFNSYAPLVTGNKYGGTFAGITAAGKKYVVTLNLVPSYYIGGYGRTYGQYWKATQASTLTIKYLN